MTDPVLLLLSSKIRKSGKSQSELARLTGLSQPTIYNIAHCYTQPNSGTIAKLMTQFRLTIVEEP